MNDARTITSQLGDLRGSDDSQIRDDGPTLPGTRTSMPHGEDPVTFVDVPVGGARWATTPMAAIVTTDADDNVTDVSPADG